MPTAVCPFVLCLTAVAVVSVAEAHAQPSPDDILRELAAMRVEVRQLREELEALKAPAPDVVQAQLAEFAQTKVESTSRFR